MEKKLFGNICFTRLVKALMLSYFLTMLMLLGLSFGLYKFDLSEKTVRIGILAVYIISTFAGGFAMGKMGKTRKFLRGFMLGMLYFLLLLAISAGIYRSVQGGMQMMIAWILCGAGGMLGGVLKGRRCNFCVDGIKGYGRYFYFLIRGKQLRQKEAYTIL